MDINSLFKEKKAVFSFEIFPPKVTSPIDTIYGTLEALSGLAPDYISITYGAGGAARSSRTLELATLVKRKYGIEPLAHLTAIHSDKNGVLDFLEDMKQNGLNNILALRGDKKEDCALSKDFRYASDLVTFIKQNSSMHISGACYPEGHFESETAERDLQNLKTKVDCGVTHLNTQLFFDNDLFYRFIERARKGGINVPIQAGIMPVINKRQIERMVSLGGVTLPSKFSKLVARYGDDDISMRAAGIAYATDQIINLLTSDVQGIHLYIMNNAGVARQISDNISCIIKGINNRP
ncbi:MAG: methylenetetrahydrofolate reductase [NAD(P)H] [Clostridia bacterium]|nr:methylenetetrahydrofolate reductase [NAD(P)H] [Clostridia bacterium]